LLGGAAVLAGGAAVLAGGAAVLAGKLVMGGVAGGCGGVKGAPHLWHCGIPESLTAAHASHNVSLRSAAHSLQYLAPAGLTCWQNAQRVAVGDDTGALVT